MPGAQTHAQSHADTQTHRHRSTTSPTAPSSRAPRLASPAQRSLTPSEPGGGIGRGFPATYSRRVGAGRGSPPGAVEGRQLRKKGGGTGSPPAPPAGKEGSLQVRPRRAGDLFRPERSARCRLSPLPRPPQRLVPASQRRPSGPHRSQPQSPPLRYRVHIWGHSFIRRLLISGNISGSLCISAPPWADACLTPRVPVWSRRARPCPPRPPRSPGSDYLQRLWCGVHGRRGPGAWTRAAQTVGRMRRVLPPRRSRILPGQGHSSSPLSQRRRGRREEGREEGRE